MPLLPVTIELKPLVSLGNTGRPWDIDVDWICCGIMGEAWLYTFSVGFHVENIFR